MSVFPEVKVVGMLMLLRWFVSVGFHFANILLMGAKYYGTIRIFQ